MVAMAVGGGGGSGGLRRFALVVDGVGVWSWAGADGLLSSGTALRGMYIVSCPSVGPSVRSPVRRSVDEWIKNKTNKRTDKRTNG